MVAAIQSLCNSFEMCRNAFGLNSCSSHTTLTATTNNNPTNPDNTTNTNNNTTNVFNQTSIQNHVNVTNNVIVNAFGQEDVEHITPAFLDQCVRRTNKGMVELIEKIHFNKDKAENRNLKATNVKVPLIRYHDGTTWKYGRKDRILDQLVDKGHDMMQGHFEDHEDIIRESVSDSMFDHIHTWLDKVREKDRRTWDDVVTDIYILILNSTVDRGDVVS
jgi:hypothetical protein